MGRKGSRYTVQEKLFYIDLVIKEGWRPYAVESKYAIEHSHVQQWIERYEADGLEGLKPRRTLQEYTQEFKLEVVQKYLAGNTSYPQLAREYGVFNGAVIYNWVSLYTSGKLLKTTRRASPMKDGRKTT